MNYELQTTKNYELQTNYELRTTNYELQTSLKNNCTKSLQTTTFNK